VTGVQTCALPIYPEETRLAIVLPTGTGKAYTLCARAVRYLDSFEGAGNRVLVLVHTDELTDQLEASARYVAQQWPLTDCGGATFSVGVVKAGRDEVNADIVIGSVATLANPARRARLRDVGLVIVDECHHAVANSYQAIMRHFGCMEGNNPCSLHTGWIESSGGWIECSPGCLGNLPHEQKVPALGFTATLERGDGQGLGTVWQNVAYTRDIGWAVRKGYLKQPIGYRLEIDLDGSEMAGADHWTTGNATALDMQIADSIAPERIVDKWQELAKDRQTIVFAPLVRSARMIARAFVAAGLSASIGEGSGTVAVIHGELPAQLRRNLIADFKAGRIQVLVNAMVLTEGFDHPNVSCVIVARPTRSRPLFIQMAGRGLRRIPGIPIEDQDCILITLADATSDICSIADLSDRPLDRTADGALTVMEDQWDIGKELDDQQRHWAGKVDATQFDPLVARSSKVWATTKGGRWFLPISTDREYVFLLDEGAGGGASPATSIYLLTRGIPRHGTVKAQRLHADIPDLAMAMLVAEDEATDRGGDLGALVADRSRPWRKVKPKPDDKMIQYAERLGLADEVRRIMDAPTGGKAGKISDLIRRVEASRTIDGIVEKINARKATT